MTTVDNNPIPTFYVREETTAGPLFFYPRPAVLHQPDRSWARDTRDITWTDARGAHAEERGGYLITLDYTPTLVATWPTSPTVSHYRHKPEEDMSPLARTLVSADPGMFPPRIEKADWEGRCEWGRDSDCTDCSWHQVRSGIYERVMTEAGTRSHTYDVSGLAELDICQPDPDPDAGYKLDSPSLAAFYPRPAHHQFPGVVDLDLEMVAGPVRKVLAELGVRPATFYVWQQKREISVSVEIVYDETLPWRRAEGRRKAIRELNQQRERAATVATTWRGEVKVPATVHGATKAEALANREQLIGELGAKLVPPHTVACSACKGFGYVR